MIDDRVDVYWFNTEAHLRDFEELIADSGIPCRSWRGDLLLNPNNRPEPWALSVQAVTTRDWEWIAGLAREAGSAE